MLRYRQRRYCLAAAGVSLLWITLLAAIVRLSYVHAARHSAVRGPGRAAVAIRTRQGILPIKMTEFEALKIRPLDQWTDKQRTLLNMTSRPWLSTPSDCAQLRTGFSSDLPTTGLVSLPSSGNTWLRFLIEGATGVFTGSLYSDITIVKAGMYGELVPHDSGTTIAQKTHGFTTLQGVTASPQAQREQYAHVRQLHCRAVLLVRDPAAAIVSHRHLDAAGHTGFAPNSHFEGEGWQQFVEQKVEFWFSLYAAWIQQCPADQLLLVQYERLKSQPSAELERVLKFLGVQPDPQRMSCINRFPHGSMQRRSRAGSTDTPDPFTVAQKTLIRERVVALHTLVREHRLGDGIADYL